MIRKSLIILCFIILSSFLSCSGSRANIRLQELAFPASLSAYMYGSNGELLVRGKSLKVLGKFEFHKKFWGILWSLVSISDDHDISEALNKEIRKIGGEGVINLKVEANYCGISTIPFLGILPFWPGCTNATITAEIVTSKL